MAQSLQVKSVSWWHESIVDWELANPHLKMKDLAIEFAVTETHLSVIRNSDAFKAYRAQRRKDHDENISQRIVQKTGKLAELTLDVMQEKIEQEREDLGLNAVRETAEMALRALGYGGSRNQSVAANTQVNISIGVSPEDLANARAKMKTINQKREDEITQEALGNDNDGAAIALPAPT